MGDDYRIILTSQALGDLEKAAEYIREDSAEAAVRMADRIIGAIDSLSTMPERYRVAGTSRTRGTAIHAMVIRPFVVYYCIKDGARGVIVLTVVHGSRRQPRKFE